jgi:hypothetical protein
MSCQRAIIALSHELQIAPLRDKHDVQAERPSQALGRVHSLFRGLTIDVKCPGESEDETGTLLKCHAGASAAT